MSKKRFRPRGGGSFFGELIYERAVPKNHFLRQLNEVVDFRPFDREDGALLQRWGRVWPDPYEPALLLKMLLLSYLYNHKQHVSLDAQTGLITSVHHSDGSAYDGHHLMGLIEQDLEQGIGMEVVAADRGYDACPRAQRMNGENHYFLELQGIGDALCLNRYRTQKKDQNKEGWLALRQSAAYQEGLRERYKVERKFGEMKQLVRAEMRARLKKPEKKSIYRKRQGVAEQVMGQIKHGLGFERG